MTPTQGAEPEKIALPGGWLFRPIPGCDQCILVKPDGYEHSTWWNSEARAFVAATTAPAPSSPEIGVLVDRVAVLEEALRPFAEFGRDEGITPEDLILDRVVDWFGISEFDAASAVLSEQPAALVLPPLTSAAMDVLAERKRQVEAEGWTPGHDDEHANGEMAQAAITYVVQHYAKPVRMPEPPKYAAVVEAGRIGYEKTARFREAMRSHAERLRRENPELARPTWWPWTIAWWKPTTPRRDLVKAGALILAEIERIDRAAPVQPGQPGRDA